MRDRETRELERALRDHYRIDRARSTPQERARLVKEIEAVSAMAPVLADKQTMADFVISQIRFIRPAVWVLNIVLVAAMVVVCLLEQKDGPLLLASSMIGAASVLIATPGLFASESSHMVELECSCKFDGRSVTLARLIILGCSDVLVMTAVVVIVPVLTGTSGFAVLLHACAPYFLACAGCLWISRKGTASNTLALPIVWIGMVMALTVLLYGNFPAVYSSASLGVWALVAAVAFIWAIREVHAWLNAIAFGLDRPGAIVAR